MDSPVVLCNQTTTTPEALLPPGTLGARTRGRQTHRFCTEIIEMIIANLIHDTPSLKACAATCFAWYNVATPYLHHSLRLREWHIEEARRGLNPLPTLAELDLLPLVKTVKFQSQAPKHCWITPQTFNSRSLDYFSALVNVQDLTIDDLYFGKFKNGLEKYFGHFSPTLRSIALIRPNCLPWQLVDFLGLFPGLDNIKIIGYRVSPRSYKKPETPRASICWPFRGKLTVRGLFKDGVLRDIVAASQGARFASMDLYDVEEMQLILEACAETLETLRLHPGGLLEFYNPSTQLFHLSCNRVLRSLEVRASRHFRGYCPVLRGLLPTITSSAFSEFVMVFTEEDLHGEPLGVVDVLREMYEIKKFRLVFRLETPEASRVANLQALTTATQEEAAKGSFDFLPCPPLIVSCAVTSTPEELQVYVI